MKNEEHFRLCRGPRCTARAPNMLQETEALAGKTIATCGCLSACKMGPNAQFLGAIKTGLTPQRAAKLAREADQPPPAREALHNLFSPEL